jgi:8-oxo-dGTP pyrophosphatase MutT (NUDIX family)
VVRGYAARVPSVIEIERALSRRPGQRLELAGTRRAAVAMVLRPSPAGSDVLFIERARHEGDPWSGHMAFPGGRVDPGDADARAAAERETLEEVGVSLRGARLLGRLDDKQGNPRTRPALIISAFVYALSEPPELVLNHEVEHALWFPVRELLDPRHHVLYPARDALEFPGIQVGRPDRHIVWGLTYSFLESFFEVVGRPLPDRWTPSMRAYARRLDDDRERGSAR